MYNKLIGNENNIIFYEAKEGNRKVLRKVVLNFMTDGKLNSNI